MYRLLCDEDEEFAGFNFAKGYVTLSLRVTTLCDWLLFYSINYHGSCNADIVQKLLREVRSINPQFQAGQIRGMYSLYHIFKNECKYLQLQFIPTIEPWARRTLLREKVDLMIERKLAGVENASFVWVVLLMLFQGLL